MTYLPFLAPVVGLILIEIVMPAIYKICKIDQPKPSEIAWDEFDIEVTLISEAA